MFTYSIKIHFSCTGVVLNWDWHVHVPDWHIIKYSFSKNLFAPPPPPSLSVKYMATYTNKKPRYQIAHMGNNSQTDQICFMLSYASTKRSASLADRFWKIFLNWFFCKKKKIDPILVSPNPRELWFHKKIPFS